MNRNDLERQFVRYTQVHTAKLRFMQILIPDGEDVPGQIQPVEFGGIPQTHTNPWELGFLKCLF